MKLSELLEEEKKLGMAKTRLNGELANTRRKIVQHVMKHEPDEKELKTAVQHLLDTEWEEAGMRVDGIWSTSNNNVFIRILKQSSL